MIAELALFGVLHTEVGHSRELPQWDAVLQRMVSEAPIYEACEQIWWRCPNGAVYGWLRFLDDLRDQPRAIQVERINRYVNGQKFAEDADRHGTSDYWATPLEFLGKGGDCEDYALAKYASLLALGVPDEELRLAVVHHDEVGIAHAVLMMRWGDTAIVLDNLTDDIREHTAAAELLPIYTVSVTDPWVHLYP